MSPRAGPSRAPSPPPPRAESAVRGRRGRLTRSRGATSGDVPCLTRRSRRVRFSRPAPRRSPASSAGTYGSAHGSRIADGREPGRYPVRTPSKGMVFDSPDFRPGARTRDPEGPPPGGKTCMTHAVIPSRNRASSPDRARHRSAARVCKTRRFRTEGSNPSRSTGPRRCGTGRPGAPRLRLPRHCELVNGPFRRLRSDS